THQHHIRLRADIVVVCKKKSDLRKLDQKTVNQELLTLISRLDSQDREEQHTCSASSPAFDPD
ncbi:MAG: hypothetical protein ACOCV7_01235, partial [Desulfonatronovibrionaceae bacterium]